MKKIRNIFISITPVVIGSVAIVSCNNTKKPAKEVVKDNLKSLLVEKENDEISKKIAIKAKKFEELCLSNLDEISKLNSINEYPKVKNFYNNIVLDISKFFADVAKLIEKKNLEDLGKLLIKLEHSIETQLVENQSQKLLEESIIYNLKNYKSNNPDVDLSKYKIEEAISKMSKKLYELLKIKQEMNKFAYIEYVNKSLTEEETKKFGELTKKYLEKEKEMNTLEKTLDPKTKELFHTIMSPENNPTTQLLLSMWEQINDLASIAFD